MKRNLIKLVGGLLAGAAMLAVLSACGGSAGATDPLSAATQTTATTPTGTVTVSPVSATPGAIQPAATPVDVTPTDPLALGKLIFEKTAGGVGCAFCHGMEAKGGGPANVNAPDIRTKTEADLRAALQGGIPMMTAMIKLNDDEIAAVMAYIHTLP